MSNPVWADECEWRLGKDLLLDERGGRAIAQAVSCRLSIAVARAQSQVRSYEICRGQSGVGVGFLLVLRFSLPVLFPPDASYSSSIQHYGCRSMAAYGSLDYLPIEP
jgi:hypothetical protein